MKKRLANMTSIWSKFDGYVIIYINITEKDKHKICSYKVILTIRFFRIVFFHSEIKLMNDF